MNAPTQTADAQKLTPNELFAAYRLAAQIKRRGDQDTAHTILRAVGSKIVPPPL
jgi:hypothetical protein